MADRSWGFFKQVAVGCGGMVLVSIALIAGLAVSMMVPFNQAVDARATIDEQFGAQDQFTPAPSGAVPAERIEAFLKVRRALSGACADFAKAERQLAELEQLDQRDDVNGLVMVKEALAMSKTMIGMGPAMGHLYDARNRALLEADMGLGEFTYIYVMAYHAEILDPSGEREMFGSTVVNSRVRRALRSMLESQLEAMNGSTDDEAVALRLEIEAMAHDRDRLPWQDGVPPAVSDSFSAFRSDLDSLYCAATSPLELMINEASGVGIQSI